MARRKNTDLAKSSEMPILDGDTIDGKEAPVVLAESSEMPAGLDLSKPHGTVSGGSTPAKYFQNDKFYDREGREVTIS